MNRSLGRAQQIAESVLQVVFFSVLTVNFINIDSVIWRKSTFCISRVLWSKILLCLLTLNSFRFWSFFIMVGCMHLESESSEVLSAECPGFMSVPMYCTKCMNMVQDEPPLQFFHRAFILRQCVLTAAFCLGLFGLMIFECILGMASRQSVSWIWAASQ